MRLSNLADYAVVLMSAAARQCGSVPLHAAMLAEQTGIPGPTAQKLVSGLARAGLLVASRGSGGGVRLARPAAAISVADIIEAVEGPIALTACVAEGRHDCSLEGSCKVQPHWGVVNGAVRGALAEISLASLSKPLPPAGGVWGGPVSDNSFANTPSRVERHVTHDTPSRKREGRIEA